MAKTGQNQKISTLYPPQGRKETRIDTKGRFRLPVEFATYFKTLAQSKGDNTKTRLFVTSIDRKRIYVYLLQTWIDVAKKLAKNSKDGLSPEVFNAQDLGETKEMDYQGRVLVGAILRREMNLTDETEAHLLWYDDHLLMLTDVQYQEYRTRMLGSQKAQP